MGYYSDIRVTLTKDDYISMLNKNERINNVCRFLPDIDDPYIHQYKENGKDFVMIQLYDIKYYKEFEEVQQFEEFLKEVKSGYVFFRTGGRWDDFEYRNTAKYIELEKPFKFIDEISTQTKKEMLNELDDLNKELSITEKQFVVIDQFEILNFYKNNTKMKNFLKEEFAENNQIKLIININANENESSCSLYTRLPQDDNYTKYLEANYKTLDLIKFLGYPNKEVFLLDINRNENVEEVNQEEEEEFE